MSGSHSAVDGGYTFAGRRYYDTPRYERRGLWKGKEAVVNIDLASGSHSHWSIVAAYDEKEGDITEDLLYQSNPFASRETTQRSLAPQRGWWRVDRQSSLSCPPVLLFGDTKLLDWRQDPAESMADYAIEITHDDDKDGKAKSTTYHVHKLVLAYTSKYFAALVGSNDEDSRGFAEKNGSTSRIPFKPSLAETFPHLLDFLVLEIHKQYGAMCCQGAAGRG